jgi:hypothetical protein
MAISDFNTFYRIVAVGETLKGVKKTRKSFYLFYEPPATQDVESKIPCPLCVVDSFSDLFNFQVSTFLMPLSTIEQEKCSVFASETGFFLGGRQLDEAFSTNAAF